MGSSTLLGSKRNSIWIIKVSILLIGMQIFRISLLRYLNYGFILQSIFYISNNGTRGKKVVSRIGFYGV